MVVTDRFVFIHMPKTGGWWKRTSAYHPERHPTPVGAAIEATLPVFERAHPHFPDLSFEDFVDLCFEAARVYDGAGTGLGLYTHGVLRYYFRDPEAAAARASVDYFRTSARHDMFGVDFLDTERLNDELYAYLARVGYDPADLAFLPALGKILPEGRGRRDDQAWERYYTPALADAVRRREWALYELFPQLAR